MNLNESEVYTSEEAQKLLKISDSTFRRLIKKGVLRAAKIGGQYRVLGREILLLLNPSLPGKVKGAYKRVVEKLEASEV
ncbi:helix-turn-helix domain-containing protein [Candidatus Margulisiibacteriota bacterium]